MEDYPNETSSDSSPFDLPRNFFYESITDYYLKKAEHLQKIKNFELAIKELTGLLDCALRDENNKLARNLEKRLLKAESVLSQRTESREKLKYSFEQFIKSFENKNQTLNESSEINSTKKNQLEISNTKRFSSLLKSIKTFTMESRLTEEYSNLIVKILTYYSKNINELSINNAFKTLKNAIEKVLTFDPLKYVLESGKIDIETGLSPFLLFDLDSTLFDNSPRVFKIVQDFIHAHNHSYPDDIKKLYKLKRKDIIWGIKENLKKLEIKNEQIVNHVISFWSERFFTNEYIVDIPLRGSQQFVKDAELIGIKIIYLTGRFESMKDGTKKNILEYGFPLDDKCSNLLLKPDPKMPDHIFKHEAMEKVKKMGNMLAGFENEPLNSNIFKSHFPESEVFFLETNHSMNPPNLLDTIHTIPNFSYLLSEL